MWLRRKQKKHTESSFERYSEDMRIAAGNLWKLRVSCIMYFIKHVYFRES
jgi:hypothetical protein